MSEMEGWATERFDEFGTIFSGSTPSTSVGTFWDGDVVWVTPSDLSKLKTPYLSDSSKRITEKGLNACSAHLVPKSSSVVISSRAPIGYVAIPIVDFCTNQGCKTIRLKCGFDPLFAYYNIVFHIEKIKRHGEGTTFAEISKSALSAIELPFPKHRAEQSKIAEVLAVVDHAIDATENLIAKQQRINSGLMQDLLTRGIDEHGNIRSEQTHSFQNSPLGRIPVEWEFNELQHYLSFLSYGFTNPMPEAADGPFLVTAANVSNGIVQYEECRRTTVDAFKNLLTNKSRPQIGDILMTKDGTLGRMAIVDRIPMCINQSVAVLRPKDGVDNEYLKLLLESPEYQKRILDDAGGSTIKHIYISKVDKMIVSVPRQKSEQLAIRERLETQLRQLRHAEQLLRKMRSLKAALMQDLLTGKRRVTPLLDTEPKREAADA